jgi:hypothetical protein
MTHPTEPLPSISDQDLPPELVEDDLSELDQSFSKNRIRIGLALAFVGYLIFLLGARPSLFGLDRSPVVGFVQISVFLLGLAIINLGSYMTLSSLWPEGTKTIAAELGSRLISTGYVICVFTGMADIFGLGSHPLPNVYFGPLQARGMTLGIMTVAVGFLLMIRYKRPEKQQVSNNKTVHPKEVIIENKEDGDSEKSTITLSTLFQ